jgi:hypothetical protein
MFDDANSIVVGEESGRIHVLRLVQQSDPVELVRGPFTIRKALGFLSFSRQSKEALRWERREEYDRALNAYEQMEVDAADSANKDTMAIALFVQARALLALGRVHDAREKGEWAARFADGIDAKLEMAVSAFLAKILQ